MAIPFLCLLLAAQDFAGKSHGKKGVQYPRFLSIA